MVKHHFSKEMDSYLESKGDKERFSELVDYASTKAMKGEKSEVIVINEKSNFQYYLDKTIGKLKRKKHVDVEDIEEEDLEKVEEKEISWYDNLVNRIKDFFYPDEDNEEGPEEKEYDETTEDFKKIAKFTTKLINMLPRRKAELLKKDSDFKEFKEILRKRKLIKE